MPLGRLNVNNNPNMYRNQFPMRGLERFMQKRGINFSGMSQRGIYQQPTPPVGQGNLSQTLNVEVPAQKSGGIKAFLSRFSRKQK